MYLLVIKQLGIMAIIVLAGFIFAKAFKVGDKEQKFLSKMLLYFINPCLVFSSFNREFSILKLQQLGFVVLVSIIVYAIMILIAIITSKNVIDRLAVVFTNCGFVGIPLINGVFGSEGVFYLLGFLTVFNVLLWTWGCYQMCGSINLKKIITNPNIIAVILGLFFYCMPFNLPEFILKPVNMIGEMNTATAMILIGVLFANFKFDSTQIWSLVRCILVRLVLCSVVNMFFLFGVYKIFGTMQDCRMMLFVILICSMCPSATSVPSLSVIYEKDTSYASLLVSVSSIVCMLTVPSFVALAELLIK